MPKLIERTKALKVLNGTNLAAEMGPIVTAAAHQRIAGDHRQVEQQLDRALGQFLLDHHPAELDPLVGAIQAFESGSRFARVDLFAEPAPGTERQAKEFELVGAGPRAFREQLQAALAHLRILLVGEQLDAVVQRADRRQQVVAQTRTEKAGELDGIHAALHSGTISCGKYSAH